MTVASGLLNDTELGVKAMMDQFVRQYRPGGMGLNHSSWWIAVQVIRDGMIVDIPVQFLQWSNYR